MMRQILSIGAILIGWFLVLIRWDYLKTERIKWEAKRNWHLICTAANKADCSEFAIFEYAGNKEKIPLAEIEDDFKHFVLEGKLPKYVKGAILWDI